MSDFLEFDSIAQEELEKTIRQLSGIASARLYAWVRFSLREAGDEFAEYVRTNWLSGRPVPIITGETRHSVGSWEQRKAQGKKVKTTFVRPGVRSLKDPKKPIPGTLNYLGKWAGTDHEFMRPAFRQFGMATKVGRALEENISRQLDKAMKESR